MNHRRRRDDSWVYPIVLVAVLSWAGWLSLQIASAATATALTNAKVTVLTTEVRNIHAALKDAEIPIYNAGVDCNGTRCYARTVREDVRRRTVALQKDTTYYAAD